MTLVPDMPQISAVIRYNSFLSYSSQNDSQIILCQTVLNYHWNQFKVSPRWKSLFNSIFTWLELNIVQKVSLRTLPKSEIDSANYKIFYLTDSLASTNVFVSIHTDFFPTKVFSYDFRMQFKTTLSIALYKQTLSLLQALTVFKET